MRVLPYFVGAATLVAIGGAAMGGAIDTTPRQIFDSSATIPAGSGITYDNDRREMPTANHYPLEAGDKRYEVAELRERGFAVLPDDAALAAARGAPTRAARKNSSKIRTK